ncbi:unnamed protein product [Leptosia nina]|uniref:Uncharacterized protein n=1 Tax=Leptosia nina TaxID=320188 RepID=A0AAV1JTC7_9NEOP
MEVMGRDAATARVERPTHAPRRDQITRSAVLRARSNCDQISILARNRANPCPPSVRREPARPSLALRPVSLAAGNFTNFPTPPAARVFTSVLP